MKKIMGVVCVGMVMAVGAAPSVSGITVAETSAAIKTITYTLQGGPAIITLDILKDGESIGGVAVKHVSGDVNRIITGDGTHTIKWATGSDWPKGVDPAACTIAVNAWDVEDPPAYMAVCLSSTNAPVFFYTSAEAFPEAEGVQDLRYKTDWLVMRKCPAKGVTWKMGLNNTDKDGTEAGRATAHKVTFTKDFYMAIYELTRGQVRYFDTSAGATSLDARPYASINYSTIRGSSEEGYDWPKNKSVKESSVIGKIRKVTGIDFDLPTDAQWEYACRAGVATAFNNGYNGTLSLGETFSNGVAECAHVYGKSTQVVGLLKPNNWGIYDMHGNVWEFCLDWCRYTLADETDPEGPESISVANGAGTIYKAGTSGDTETVGRVVRGGYYGRCVAKGVTNGGQVRSAHRNWYKDTTTGDSLGCRLACPCPAVK